MTGGQYREVDLDLLADYVGGALHGTPDEIEIARLVDRDPAWAEAYAALTAGLDAVRLDLAAWAAEPIPMPSPVLDRLDAALARAALPDSTEPAAATSPAEAPGPLAGTPTELAETPGAADLPGATPDSSPEGSSPEGSSPEDSSPEGSSPEDSSPEGSGSGDPNAGDSGSGPSIGSGPGGPTHPAGRPRRQQPAEPTRAGGGTQRPGTPGRRRRWTRRMAAPVLIATVVAGFAGFALSGLVDGGDSAGDHSTGTAMNSREDAAAPQILGSGPPVTVVEPSAERVLSTGTDYTPDSLPDTISNLARQAVPATKPPQPSPRGSGQVPENADPAASSSTESRASAPSPCCPPIGADRSLDRLGDRSVLADCLDQIAAAHAQGPVAVELVDYATFQGRAALVVVFTDQSGARWAWVTGPNCGSPAAGADVTYQSRVG